MCYGHDAVVDISEIQSLGIKSSPLLEGAAWCDALLIFNNHPRNVPDGLIARMRGRETLVFDGWSQLDCHDVEQYSGVTYATMGYMTPERLIAQ